MNTKRHIMIDKGEYDHETSMDYMREAMCKFRDATNVPEIEFWRSVVLGMRILSKERYDQIGNTAC